MKRYLAFFGATYYPLGGMDDLVSDGDTIEECKNAINEKIKEGFNPECHILEDYEREQWEYSWAHIYDTKDCKKAWSREQPF